MTSDVVLIEGTSGSFVTLSEPALSEAEGSKSGGLGGGSPFDGAQDDEGSKSGGLGMRAL